MLFYSWGLIGHGLEVGNDFFGFLAIVFIVEAL